MEYTSTRIWGTSDKYTYFVGGIAIDDLEISGINPRIHRNANVINEIADLIRRHGYDGTQAIKVFRDDEKFKIFAGGNRFEAAKLAGLQEIPVYVYEGFSLGELWSMAYADNEQAGKHTGVHFVDTWLDYKRQIDNNGWTQTELSDFLGESNSRISYKLRYANFADSVIDAFFTIQGLTESHARNLLDISQCENLTPWLTRETAMLHVIEIVTSKGAFTAKDFEREVELLNKTIEKVESKRQDFNKYWFMRLLKLLQDKESFNQASAQRAIDDIIYLVAEDARKAEEEARIKADEAERAKVEAEREERNAQQRKELLSKVHLGDFRELMQSLPDNSVDLIFTDPPYDEKHIQDYGDLAKIAARVLKPNGSIIVYVGHYALLKVGNLMSEHLTFWWPLVVKHSGNAARLPGKWVFVHYKPLLWFTKGGRRDNRYVSDFIHSQQPKKDLHVWQQDLNEAMYCIEQLTEHGDLVVDPFCGSGTTSIAALELERDFWTCDIDIKSYEKTQGRLLEWLKK